MRTRFSDDEYLRNDSLIRYFEVYWVIEDAVISCIWCLVEDRIGKEVSRYWRFGSGKASQLYNLSVG